MQKPDKSKGLILAAHEKQLANLALFGISAVEIMPKTGISNSARCSNTIQIRLIDSDSIWSPGDQIHEVRLKNMSKIFTILLKK